MRKINSSQISSIEPWNEATTTTKATGNTQNIYQNGKVGIGNFDTTAPAASLDIETGGTAAAPNPTGFKLVDGNQDSGKILVSDANGVGTWKALGVVIGVARAGTVPLNSQGALLSATTFTYTNYYITVPPGISLVRAGFVVDNNGIPQGGYATFGVSTTSPATLPTLPNGAGIQSFPSVAAFAIVANSYSAGQVVFNVNNTTGAPVTVYLFGRISASFGATTRLGLMGTNGYGEVFIYVQQ